MKVLWISNAPDAPSGYGSQTRQVGLRIARAGYDIEFVSNSGSRGDREWNGLLVRGSGGDRYSRDTIRQDLEQSGADQVIFLYDAWVYTEGMEDPFEGIPHVAGWVPVDHYPTPPSIYGWLRGGHLPIAMSQFGRDCLRATSAGFVAQGLPAFPVEYIPHAVEDVFAPRDRAFRDLIDVPQDAYLVGIVAANNGTKVYDRKGFGDMAHAAAVFLEDHPDAWLYVHTIPDTFDGMNLVTLMRVKGVDPNRLRWADPYALKKWAVSDEQMAGIYSAFDVLLATSRGEGFGLPVIEAQACGVPAIVSNWTAQPELVGEPFSIERLGSVRTPSGWMVSTDPDYDHRQAADFGKPRIGSIIAALSDAYEHRGDETIHTAALAKAEGYRADAVFESYWRPLLSRMEAAHRRPNRAERRKARKLKVVA